jgi:hypothetical protein
MRFDPSTSNIRSFPRSAINRYPGSGPVGRGGTGTEAGEPVVECVEPAEPEFTDVVLGPPRVQLTVTMTTKIRQTVVRRIRPTCATGGGSVQTGPSEDPARTRGHLDSARHEDDQPDRRGNA